jgi:hypothetical protein
MLRQRDWADYVRQTEIDASLCAELPPIAMINAFRKLSA